VRTFASWSVSILATTRPMLVAVSELKVNENGGKLHYCGRSHRDIYKSETVPLDHRGRLRDLCSLGPGPCFQ
jgi:hypothetical protein